jgi:tetratricopeptide (TPR) repeat protein
MRIVTSSFRRSTIVSVAVLLLAVLGTPGLSRLDRARAAGGRAENPNARRYLSVDGDDGSVDAVRRALDAGDPQEALGLLDDLLDASGSPTTAAELHLLAAEAWAALEDPEAVLAETDAAQSADAAHDSERRARISSWAWLEVGEATRAIEALEPLIRRAPTDTQLAVELSEAYGAAGELRRAESLLESIASSSRSPGLLYRLGVLLHDRGLHERAERLFGEVLAAEPSQYYAAIYRARSLLALSRGEAALNLVESRLRGDATAELWYLHGRALRILARSDEAISSFRNAIGLDPEYSEALYALGIALRATGRDDDASDALAKFETRRRRDAERLVRGQVLEARASRAPQDADLHLEAARDHEAAKEPEAAERYAWRVLRLRPDTIDARVVLARALRAQGRYQAAATQYRRIIMARPSDATIEAEFADLIRGHGRGAERDRPSGGEVPRDDGARGEAKK